MGCSIDPFHYRQRHFLLLFYESPPHKNRERCCQGLTDGSTPAWWIQSLVDSHTRSLQQITCTKINATLQFSQTSEKCKERSSSDCTLTGHRGFLPQSHSGTDGHISLPNIVISIVTLIKHLGTHPGALIPHHVSVRGVRWGATVNF